MAAQPQQRPQPSFHGLGELEAAGERRVVLNRPMLVSGSGGKWHVSEQLTPTSAAAAKTTNFFGSSDQRPEGGRAELKWEGAKEQGDEEEKGCGWVHGAEAKDTMAAQPQQRPQPSFHGLGDLEACGERRVVLNRPMLISGTGGQIHVSEQQTPTSKVARMKFFGEENAGAGPAQIFS